jgi:hypothetical protein
MWGVLTPAIKLWVFGSLRGLQVPTFGSVNFILTLASKWGCDIHNLGIQELHLRIAKILTILMQPSPLIKIYIYMKKRRWFISKYGPFECNESKTSLWLKGSSICIKTTYSVLLVEVTFPWNSYDYHILLVPFQIFFKCKELRSMPPNFPYFSSF